MKDKLTHIKMLEKQLQQVDDRIETLKKEIIEDNLINDNGSLMNWDRDDELSRKEKELNNLEVERDKIQMNLLRLTDFGE